MPDERRSPRQSTKSSTPSSAGGPPSTKYPTQGWVRSVGCPANPLLLIFARSPAVLRCCASSSSSDALHLRTRGPDLRADQPDTKPGELIAGPRAVGCFRRLHRGDRTGGGYRADPSHGAPERGPGDGCCSGCYGPRSQRSR